MKLASYFLLIAALPAAAKSGCLDTIRQAQDATSRMYETAESLADCGAAFNVMDACKSEHVALQAAYADYSRNVEAVRVCVLGATEVRSEPAQVMD